jgi:type IV fimbrial biogenesis protein FimT
MSTVPRGYTLPELLTTLAIAAVLAAMAVPGFGAVGDAWALRAAASAVLSGLAQARTAALARGEDARLCPSRTGLACTAGAASGFLVVGGESAPVVLRVGDLGRRVELSANRPAATYYPWPRSASPVTLTLCAVRQRSRSLRVIVSQAGRPRVEAGGAC